MDDSDDGDAVMMIDDFAIITILVLEEMRGIGKVVLSTRTTWEN